MKLRLVIVLSALTLFLPAAAQTPDTPPRNRRNDIQLRLDNGSTLTGRVSYITPDGKIVELQTATGSLPVWFSHVEAVRRDKGKEDKRWRECPDAQTFRRRYDPTWQDPSRWEFGFYSDYGFGVGTDALDRYEAGINLRYGVNRYLFAGVGIGINSMKDIDRGGNESVFAERIHTTGCAAFADLRSYFRDHGIRPFADLRIGYNFPTSSYTDSQSRDFSDKGFLLRAGAGIAAIDRSDIAYTLSVGYQIHSIRLTEPNENSFRHLSGSVALQLTVTFRW